MATVTAEDRLTAMLKAIADPVRRRIIRLLAEKTGCCSIGARMGLCACDIEQRVELTQPTVSHHMAILRDAGLVDAEKVGQWMWYRRNEKSLKELARTLAQEL